MRADPSGLSSSDRLWVLWSSASASARSRAKSRFTGSDSTSLLNMRRSSARAIALSTGCLPRRMKCVQFG